MHVRHVVRQFHPAIGGLENAVANLASALRDTGIYSSIVTLDRAFGDPATRLCVQDEHDGVPVVRIPYRGTSRYPIAPSVLRALDGADLVHVHGIDFFFDFLAATRPLHRKPLVASTHGGFFHTAYASAAKRVYFQTVTRASAQAYRSIIASSESDAARFTEIASARTMTIENGVDVEKWRDAASLVPTRTMLFIGRFSINKNVPALFPILARLAAGGSDWRLIVAGMEADLTPADLATASRHAGVSDRVEFHFGADDAALRALVARSSYIISASRYEGFGISAVEGLSAGLTPLLSDIPPFRRLVDTTARGLLFDPEDPAGAAALIERHHNGSGSAHEAVRRLNIAASDRYAWGSTAAAFAREYRRIL